MAEVNAASTNLPEKLSGSELVKFADELVRETDLYAVLQVARDASVLQLKHAYRQRSLALHPDRFSLAEDRVVATRCFQRLGLAHQVLSDPESRSIYDESGELPDSVGSGLAQRSEQDWAQYWRLLFPQVTAERLNEFALEYRNSAQEHDDLIKLYQQYEGDFNKIMDGLALAEFDHEERLLNKLRDLIKSEALSETALFRQTTSAVSMKRRQKRALRERREFERQDVAGPSGSNDLVALLQARQQERHGQLESCIDGLMAKYCTGGKRGNRKNPNQNHECDPLEPKLKKRRIQADMKKKNCNKKKSK